jgi:hypothetical protein
MVIKRIRLGSRSWRIAKQRQVQQFPSTGKREGGKEVREAREESPAKEEERPTPDLEGTGLTCPEHKRHEE